jgi:superfamily I DNA/RNA helicase
MSRLAEHLERLTAGDESNAVIDAGDSVSLMTIHAAKGLEFPVVFVVNLSRGTGGRRHAIRVVADAEHGAAWLSVGDFQVGSRRRREGQRPRGNEASAFTWR